MNNLENERNELFDDSFKHKTDDVNRIREFCKGLSDVTGVQVCNNVGSTYEYLPQVYRSVVRNNEM